MKQNDQHCSLTASQVDVDALDNGDDITMKVQTTPTNHKNKQIVTARMKELMHNFTFNKYSDS